MPDTLTLPRPDDWHAHLRDGELMQAMVAATRDFGRVLVMPNLTPPVATAEQALTYRKRILDAHPNFEPLMTIKVLPSTTPEVVAQAAAAGVVAGKLYPEGVTTNSADGVRDVRALADTFAAMAEARVVLCLHGETPGVSVLDAEQRFLEETLPWIVESTPDLLVVLEHASTAAAVAAVRSGPANLAATITVHHLLLTIDDVLGSGMQPHHYCKPIPKREPDCDALVATATSGNPKFFLGTDSAPHLREKKECVGSAAGVFTAPVALPLLAELFDAKGALDKLEGFASCFGAQFYGRQPSTSTLTLVKQPMQVPEEFGGVVPLRAGGEIAWSVQA